jgi:hypothetical protein
MAGGMDRSRTKLAVRTVLVGFRAAKVTAEQVGGVRGEEIAATAKRRAGEILDEIDQYGTKCRGRAANGASGGGRLAMPLARTPRPRVM